jgi:hypothetical protein
MRKGGYKKVWNLEMIWIMIMKIHFQMITKYKKLKWSSVKSKLRELTIQLSYK